MFKKFGHLHNSVPTPLQVIGRSASLHVLQAEVEKIDHRVAWSCHHVESCEKSYG